MGGRNKPRGVVRQNYPGQQLGSARQRSLGCEWYPRVLRERAHVFDSGTGGVMVQHANVYIIVQRNGGAYINECVTHARNMMSEHRRGGIATSSAQRTDASNARTAS